MSAEGAKGIAPNLSGKRTEHKNIKVFSELLLLWQLFFIGVKNGTIFRWRIASG